MQIASMYKSSVNQSSGRNNARTEGARGADAGRKITHEFRSLSGSRLRPSRSSKLMDYSPPPAREPGGRRHSRFPNGAVMPVVGALLASESRFSGAGEGTR